MNPAEAESYVKSVRYNRPSKTRIKMIKRISPKPPLG
jgi:hypothetical protein